MISCDFYPDLVTRVTFRVIFVNNILAVFDRKMSYMTHKPHPQAAHFGHKKAKTPNFRGFREIEMLARIERFEQSVITHKLRIFAVYIMPCQFRGKLTRSGTSPAHSTAFHSASVLFSLSKDTPILNSFLLSATKGSA